MVMVGNGGPPVIWAGEDRLEPHFLCLITDTKLTAFSVLRSYALGSRKWWIIPLVSIFFLPDIILTSVRTPLKLK